MSKLAFKVRAFGKAGRALNWYTTGGRMRALLGRAGLSHARAIHTFTTREELAALADLALCVPAGGRILEIGSYLGASTCYLAAGALGRNVSITCIDTWQNENMPDGVRDTLGEFRRNLAPVE